MRFSNQRGRPKKIKDKIDLGTEELRAKKKSQISENSLTILKNLKFIDEIEYQTALWFRYLYSIKFGNPNIITAYNTAKIYGLNSFTINQIKREKVEKLYNKISYELQKVGVKNIVMDVCVFDARVLNLKLNDRRFVERLKEGLKVIKSFYAK